MSLDNRGLTVVSDCFTFLFILYGSGDKHC